MKRGTIETKNLNIPLSVASFDRLYLIARRLAEQRGWINCTLQQAVQYLIEESPMAQGTRKRKPAGRAQATGRARARAAS